MGYREEVLADAPLLYYRMEETGGTTIASSGSLNLTATLVGGVQLHPSGVGGGGSRSIYCDGVDDYVSIPDSLSLDVSSVTVEAWAYLYSFGTAGPYLNRRTAGNVGGFTLEGGTFYVYTSGASGLTWYPASAVAPTLQAWHHIVGTYSPGLLQIYMDGQLAASSTAPTGIVNAPAGVLTEMARNIGAPGYVLQGHLDEVAMYGTALSKRRIQDHFRAGWKGSGWGYRDRVLGEKPRAYWRLGETSGFTANDSTANAYHGTHISSPSINQPGALVGDADGAVGFNGVDEYVVTPLPMTAVTAWTVEAWVKTTATGTPGVVVAQTRGPTPNTAARSFTLTVGAGGGFPPVPGTVTYGLEGDGLHVAVQTAMTVNDGKWHHIVGVWSGSAGVVVTPAQSVIYIDGVLRATPTTAVAGQGPAPPFTGAVNVRLAYHEAWAQYAAATLDEVAIYDRALSAYEVASHYALGQPYQAVVLGDGPTAYWPLDEPSGTVARDLSGNGYHGTYAGDQANHFWVQQSSVQGSLSHAVNNAANNGSAGPYIDMGFPAVFSAPATFTIECWVFMSAPRDGTTIIGPHNNAFGGYGLVVSGTGVPFLFHMRIRDNQFINSARTYAANAWHHLVGTGDGSTYRIYGDGVLDNSAAKVDNTGGCGAGNPFLVAGLASGWGGPSGFRGRVDEAAFYTTALSADQILAHYRTGLQSRLSRWDGASWLPLEPKRWDGSQWVAMAVRRWDGTQWV